MNTNAPSNFTSVLCNRCNVIFPNYDLYMQHEPMCCFDQQQLSLHQQISNSNSTVVQRVVPNQIARQFMSYPTPGRNLEPFRGFQNPTNFSRPCIHNGGNFIVSDPNQQMVRAVGDGNQSGNGRVNVVGAHDGANLTTRDFLSGLERQIVPNSEGCSSSRDASDETELDLDLHL